MLCFLICVHVHTCVYLEIGPRLLEYSWKLKRVSDTRSCWVLAGGRGSDGAVAQAVTPAPATKTGTVPGSDSTPEPAVSIASIAAGGLDRAELALEQTTSDLLSHLKVGIVI